MTARCECSKHGGYLTIQHSHKTVSLEELKALKLDALKELFRKVHYDIAFFQAAVENHKKEAPSWNQYFLGDVASAVAEDQALAEIINALIKTRAAEFASLTP